MGRLSGLALALVGLADNVSTVLALSGGATEANPLVAPFTQDPALFAAFTVAKCAVLYLVGKSLNPRKAADLLVLAILLAVFLQATAINVANWWAAQCA
jgi:hypothetical protein